MSTRQKIGRVAKIGFLMILILLVFVVPAIAQEVDVIQAPPMFVIGDTWKYNGYASLDDAKKGQNPTVRDITRTIHEIDEKNIIVTDTKGDQRIYDKTFNLLERKRVSGQNTFYKPFWPGYKYPMRIGDKHKVKFSHNRPDGYDNDYVATIRVIGWETVTVPAGTFSGNDRILDSPYVYGARGTSGFQRNCLACAGSKNASCSLPMGSIMGNWLKRNLRIS